MATFRKQHRYNVFFFFFVVVVVVVFYIYVHITLVFKETINSC